MTLKRLVCGEFDEFADALCGVQGRYLLRARQEHEWRLSVVDLDGVELMLGREGAANLYSGAAEPDRFQLFFPLTGQHAVTFDGRPFGHRIFGWMVPGEMFHLNATRPTSWLGVALNTELVSRWVERHRDEFDFSLLDGSRSCVAHWPKTRIAWIVHRILQVAALAPDDIHAPAAKQAARQEVLDTALHTLPRANTAPIRSTGDRTRILKTALGLMECLQEEAISTDDLCAATGASERTLRNIFNDYVGMSPHRYLVVRRLHAIRSAIRQAGPGETVTTLCAKYGVWDFGRFARQYKEFFGVLPSQSLYGHRHWPRSKEA